MAGFRLGVLFWFLPALLGGCGPAPQRAADPLAGAPQSLSALVTSQIDSVGQVAPAVRVSLPHRALIFHRDEEGYRATILVQVTALRDGQQVGGGVGSATVRVATESETRTETEVFCAAPLVLRGEEPVTLAVAVTIQGTARIWRRELDYRPLGSRSQPLFCAGVSWNVDAQAGDQRCLGLDADTLRVTVAMTRNEAVPWPEGAVLLRGDIATGEDGDPTISVVDLAESSFGSGQASRQLVWAARDLPFGALTLLIQLEAPAEGGATQEICVPDRAVINLQVAWWSDRQWRRHVGWLEGVLSEPERQQLRDLAPDQREAAWTETWQQIGTVGGMSGRDAQRVHLLRIVGADRRYGRFGRGSLSDRGRVFIRYGEPDRVEQFTDELARESHWEIWYYGQLGLRFSFLDQQGMGDYRLHETQRY